MKNAGESYYKHLSRAVQNAPPPQPEIILQSLLWLGLSFFLTILQLLFSWTCQTQLSWRINRHNFPFFPAGPAVGGHSSIFIVVPAGQLCAAHLISMVRNFFKVANFEPKITPYSLFFIVCILIFCIFLSPVHN